MQKLIISLSLLLIIQISTAQEQASISSLNRKAGNLVKEGKYQAASVVLLQIMDLVEFKTQKQSAAYNAACCLAMLEKTDSAFILLNKALELGYNNKEWIREDPDLLSLRKTTAWEAFLKTVPEAKKLNANPDSVNIVTEDVLRFWKAYEKGLKDTAHFELIFEEEYFSKASLGLEDYLGSKVPSKKYFFKHLKNHPKLYGSIKENSLKVEEYKKDLLADFKKFKAFYPEAKFPDVYFVMGAFTSAGTVSSAGLLIGVNQMSNGEGVNTEELTENEILLLSDIQFLPDVVAHELIHFQQDDLLQDTLTLGYAIEEGMADFIGELISGQTSNQKIFDWTKGKEKVIWEQFKEDMYFDRYDNWIANYGHVAEDSYPDLGYWIGYEICKAYYEYAKDKSQAIYDMLHIQDYQKFLEDSRWEKKLEGM